MEAVRCLLAFVRSSPPTDPRGATGSHPRTADEAGMTTLSPTPFVTAAGAPSAPRPAARHLTALDVFRAVVCLQIVGMHAYFAAAARIPDRELSAGLGWAVVNLRFGFESFFVLAGYFLAHNFRPGEPEVLSLAGFFRRRLLRLAVPFWVAVGLGVGWFLISAAIKGVDPHPGTRNLAPLLLFVHDLVPSGMPTVAYWFVAPLMQFYLLWGVGFWLARRWHLIRQTPDHHDSALRVMVVLTGLTLVASFGCVAAGWNPKWRLADNALYLALGCFAFWRGAGLRVGVFLTAA